MNWISSFFESASQMRLGMAPLVFDDGVVARKEYLRNREKDLIEDDASDFGWIRFRCATTFRSEPRFSV